MKSKNPINLKIVREFQINQIQLVQRHYPTHNQVFGKLKNVLLHQVKCHKINHNPCQEFLYKSDNPLNLVKELSLFKSIRPPNFIVKELYQMKTSNETYLDNQVPPNANEPD